ncbi:hypothetical protein K505DRAFT_387573 [Melanomma pulvis-pyrius CBS 109.77]|uniref:Uncharacterized protein n=1 Tax=Melanomma pulvis-pyrius CBS 109.77 TaxID=1314802 RepID=A0A6A6X952_9PLEO|nr:hypothetical protein K505DRAFT_387573 [Melanomma pulvis-pyrius CBS 109.77]
MDQLLTPSINHEASSSMCQQYTLLTRITTLPLEVRTFTDVTSLCNKSTDYGGLGLTPTIALSSSQQKEVIFLISAGLESLNSSERLVPRHPPVPSRPQGRRGMTLTEEIFAAHDVERRGWVAPDLD